MKKIIGFFTLLWIVNSSTAQSHYTDSLQSILATASKDATTVNVLNALSGAYYDKNNFDSALHSAYRGLELAQSIEYKKGEIDCMQTLVSMSWDLGDFATSIKFAYPIIEYARDNKDTSLLVYGHAMLSNSYRDQGDFKEALQTSKNRMPIIFAWDNCRQCGVAYAAIGYHYFGLEQYDSALFYIEKGLTYPKDFAYGWKLMMAGRRQLVVLSTRNLGEEIQISEKDNGNGVTGNINEKIFQPFVTTKPSGQGTGLRLSLANDIVTKGDVGELNVATQEGRGPEFILPLPS